MINSVLLFYFYFSHKISGGKQRGSSSTKCFMTMDDRLRLTETPKPIPHLLRWHSLLNCYALYFKTEKKDQQQ